MHYEKRLFLLKCVLIYTTEEITDLCAICDRDFSSQKYYVILLWAILLCYLLKVLKSSILITIKNNNKSKNLTLSSRYIYLWACIWQLLIFFYFLWTPGYCEKIFLFMRYTYSCYGLHWEYLQHGIYENFTRIKVYIGTVWCQVFFLRPERHTKTAIMISIYIRAFCKDGPWFSTSSWRKMCLPLCSSLLWWDPTWNTASTSGAPNTGRTWSCWGRSRGGPWRWSEGWNTSPMRKDRDSWSCSSWRREDVEEILKHLPVQ